ncbi:MAG: biotin transporter BioY [Actinobacteria bacterium]|nr:biotin transporter BioY [Actinomycetota bacterium]
MSDVAVLKHQEPVVLADLVPGSLLRDIALVVGAAGLVGALAQLSIHLSFTPVPITGQTLGVLIVGTTLGWRRALAAMSLYAVAGLAGVPWFAGHTSGYVGASFGYVVGFIASAALCGYLAERRADRTWKTSAPAMVAGEAVMYTIGVAWLAVSMHVGIARALALGFTPFIIGDAIKALLAASLLPVAWKLVGSRHGSL